MLCYVALKKFIQLNLFVSLALVLSGIFLNANVWDLKCQIQSSLYCFRLSFWLAAAHQSRKYCGDVRSVWVALMMFSLLADVALKGPSVLLHQLLSLNIAWVEWTQRSHFFPSLLPLELAWHDCTSLNLTIYSFPFFPFEYLVCLNHPNLNLRSLLPLPVVCCWRQWEMPVPRVLSDQV